MRAVYLQVGKTKTMLKAKIDGRDVWFDTSTAVKSYADKNFREGEEVELTVNDKKGSSGLEFCSRIEKAGGQATYSSGSEFTCTDCGKELKDGTYKKCYTCNKKKSSSPNPGSGFTCEDCGATLKDGTYKKCWTCNKKNPSKKTGTSTPNNTSDAIARQNANHATSRTLIALQGQLDLNNIYGVIDALHAYYLKKITG